MTKACFLFLPELKQLLEAKDLATLKSVLKEITSFGTSTYLALATMIPL